MLELAQTGREPFTFRRDGRGGDLFFERIHLARGTGVLGDPRKKGPDHRLRLLVAEGDLARLLELPDEGAPVGEQGSQEAFVTGQGLLHPALEVVEAGGLLPSPFRA